MEQLNDIEFIIFDVETTGLSPASGDRLVEIAALKVRGMRPVEKFHSLIDPEREISMQAYLVNGISREMLTGAPKAGDILPGFIDFISQGCLVGHNIQFDIGFLNHELALLGRQLQEGTPVCDTLKIARRVLPNLGSYRLWFLARTLGVQGAQQHRAMADVEMTFMVFRRLLEVAHENDALDMDVFIQR